MKTNKDDWMAPVMVRLPREDKSKGLGTMSIAFGVGLVAGLLCIRFGVLPKGAFYPVIIICILGAVICSRASSKANCMKCPSCHADNALDLIDGRPVDGVYYARCSSCHGVFPTDAGLSDVEVERVCQTLNVKIAPPEETDNQPPFS